MTKAFLNPNSYLKPSFIAPISSVRAFVVLALPMHRESKRADATKQRDQNQSALLKVKVHWCKL